MQVILELYVLYILSSWIILSVRGKSRVYGMPALNQIHFLCFPVWPKDPWLKVGQDRSLLLRPEWLGRLGMAAAMTTAEALAKGIQDHLSDSGGRSRRQVLGEDEPGSTRVHPGQDLTVFFLKVNHSLQYRRYSSGNIFPQNNKASLVERLAVADCCL